MGADDWECVGAGSNFFLLGTFISLSSFPSQSRRSCCFLYMTALLTLLIGQTFDARHVIVSVLVMVWATRLAGTSSFPTLLSLDMDDWTDVCLFACSVWSRRFLAIQSPQDGERYAV